MSSRGHVVTRLVSVLLPVGVDKPYSYRVPEGLPLAAGDIVRVPLGPREVMGVVWDDGPEAVETARLKPVLDRYDIPPIDADLRRFVDWIADYTLSQRGMVLRMVLRQPETLDKGKPIAGIRFTGNKPDRMTDARRRVLDRVSDGLSWSKSALVDASGVSASVIEGLVSLGTLERISLPPPPVAGPVDPDFAPARLNEEQQVAADVCCEAIRSGQSRPVLLDGVTGAGKTEVYFEAIAETIRQGRQALVLLPEIALTSTFVERFAARFGAQPVEWHSDISAKKKGRIWRAVANGEAGIVIGARSALFLPYKALGLIVVDEEHDTAYKQEDRAVYNARDMAVVRGHLSGFPVILSSATPSVETHVNAETKRYDRVLLKGRYSGRALPDLSVIDMRRDGPDRGDWLAPSLCQAIIETMARGDQSLLFLNRRGYAPLTLCRQCGHRFQCPSCSAWLVEHRFLGRLACHHCGHFEPKPPACPSCQGEDTLVACGPGVERIAEEVEQKFPDARITVLSSDQAGGVQRLRDDFAAIARGETDIIIGTQLVAKGHTFPALTLVGVVDADLGLAQGDPRAAERTFQLLSQVTGRAGRVKGGGRGLLQSYIPEHPVLSAILAGDREAFYEREITERQQAVMPPFGRLAALVISAEHKDRAQAFARQLVLSAPRHGDVRLLGPAEAPLAVLRGQYRFRVLVQSPRKLDLSGYLRQWLESGPKPRGGVRLMVDVDPQSFL
ncbi:primosomal protein N' [Coralliovum pocilloporae]|uniref:primosomal protein N' n=1 Tax=Coralliovum pocilloporae TaxID=3066369 RepID=UPI0033078184